MSLEAYPFRCLNPVCMAPLPYLFFNPNMAIRRFEEGALDCIYCHSRDIGRASDFTPLSDCEWNLQWVGATIENVEEEIHVRACIAKSFKEAAIAGENEKRIADGLTSSEPSVYVWRGRRK